MRAGLRLSGWRLEITMDIRGMTPLLQVFDMARSLRFYRDVLGFEIVQTDTNTTAPNHNWVWLRLNDIDLMLNTAYEYDKRPSAADPRRLMMSCKSELHN